ncbi:MAG TPA: methylated-DNA--[protein]-cysteine S-methyltransferase [Anaerolineaceae bacterium]|nr:methylated-DNA--[protein]-cysteine S-methyltransferase [Anaerolineaceae bacterium]
MSIDDEILEKFFEQIINKSESPKAGDPGLTLSQLLNSFLEIRPDPIAEIFYNFRTPIGIFRAITTQGMVHSVELIDLDTKGFRSSKPKMPIQAELEAQYKAYFAKKLQRFDLPLAIESLSPFTQKVLNLLRDLPFGETCSYKELAIQAGKPDAARVVGGIMARNSWLIAIPCHRVLTVSGKIGNYSALGGVDTKVWLLRHEGHRIKNDEIVKRK